MCRNYEKGFCQFGEDCERLHVEKQLCENYMHGFCPLGKKCKNAHPKLLTEIDNIFLSDWNKWITHLAFS